MKFPDGQYYCDDWKEQYSSARRHYFFFTFLISIFTGITGPFLGLINKLKMPVSGELE